MSESKTLEAEAPGAPEAESEDTFYRTIVEGMQEAVYVRDKDRTLLYINPAAEELTGWTLKDAKTKPCFEVFGDPDRRCNLECPIDEAMVAGKRDRHKEGTIKRRDGTVLLVEVSITPLPKSMAPARSVVILRDITRMRKLEIAHMEVLRDFEKGARELRLDKQRFRDFAEVANEWLWETDAEHRFTLMTGKSFFGREAYIGKRRQELVDIETDKARWTPFFRWLEERKPFQDFIYPATGPNGESGWVSISGKPIYDENKVFIGYRGIGRNVDAEKVGD